jgi:hypothetical protein
VTSLVTERFARPASTRDAHALDAAGRRVGDVLAGRTVWCATSLPRARDAAEGLRIRVGAGPEGVAAGLRVAGDEDLLAVAEHVEDMLGGATAGWPEIGQPERSAYARAAMHGEEMFAEKVGADDVFVAHDSLSAIAVEQIRERGAHAVWRVRISGRSAAAAVEALEFLRRFTPGIDAYLLTWQGRGPRGQPVERVGAALPSAALLAIKEFPARLGGEEPRRLAWRMALAEIVRSDRGERVGGTLRPRPVVAAR